MNASDYNENHMLKLNRIARLRQDRLMRRNKSEVKMHFWRMSLTNFNQGKDFEVYLKIVFS